MLRKIHPVIKMRQNRLLFKKTFDGVLPWKIVIFICLFYVNCLRVFFSFDYITKKKKILI